MKSVIIDDSYDVHFYKKKDKSRVDFLVYEVGVSPILNADLSDTGERRYTYTCKNTGHDLDEFVDGKCEIMFEGHVHYTQLDWDTGIWFNGDLYDGEDLLKMSNLYNNTLLEMCKKFCMQDDTL